MVYRFDEANESQNIYAKENAICYNVKWIPQNSIDG